MKEEIIMIITIITFVIMFIHISEISSESDNCGPLFLTVGAVKPYLIINWQFTCDDPPDQIVLYEKNNPLLTLDNVKDKTGTYKTKNKFKSRLPGNWNDNDKNPEKGTQYFPYSTSTFRKGKLVDTNFLKIEPTWMEKFGELHIGSMMIPGTHNSGAWKAFIPIGTNFYLNQNHNLWFQLVHGIRFFDLRVDIMFNKFVIVHNFVILAYLEPELNHILNFLQKTETELIILNFHFFGWSKERFQEKHKKLLRLLNEKFKDRILPTEVFEKGSVGPTLEEIWKTGKQLIITYNDKEIVQKTNWLWFDVNRRWGNKIDFEELHEYLNNSVSIARHEDSPFTILMAEPTIRLNHDLGEMHLHNISDHFNPKLNYWLRFEQWSKRANVIAVDHFESSDVVAISIETNQKRLKAKD